MGVWIEIVLIRLTSRSSIVTPFMGVWIEIRPCMQIFVQTLSVTPFMGVWIEIVPTT